jgi:hypothetical protein
VELIECCCMFGEPLRERDCSCIAGEAHGQLFSVLQQHSPPILTYCSKCTMQVTLCATCEDDLR